MSVLLTSVSGQFMPVADVAVFEQSIRDHWDDVNFISYVGTPLGETTDVAADVLVDGKYGRIYHYTSGEGLTCDEVEFQFEIVAWASTWVREDSDFALMDSDATYAIPIRPGMTPADAEAAIVVPDWSATPPF